jgi:hypothetical protein
MSETAALSRRAVLAATAALAVGGDAPARKRRRKPKPKPPLAFVAMTATDVVLRPQGEEPGFTWTFAVALQHPGTGFAPAATPGEFNVPAAFTEGQARAEVVRQTRETASLVLGFAGIAVAPDRIDVTLL